MTMYSKREAPAWLDGDKIDEVLFCEEFVYEHPMICIHECFFTADGKVTDESWIKNLIYEKLKPYIRRGISRKVTGLLDVLRAECYSPPLPVYHKENISRTTQQSYRYTLVTLKERLGDKPINTIKAMDIEEVLRAFRKEGKSDSYVAKARGMLFQIMNKAEANELIRRNPVACAEKMRANKPMEAKEAFTADEVKRLMQELPHDKFGDSIRLMLGTGIRMQELLALEPRLIEEDGSVIHIRQAVKTVAGRVEIGEPKSRDSTRDVLIPQGLRSMVVRLRRTEDKYIFQSPRSEQPFDPKHYRDKFKEYVGAVSGVRVLTPHSCRHTYVSQMQALGVDLATIQSMVGHADLDMTKHYLHVQTPIKQKAVEVFDQAFCLPEAHSSQIPVRP